MAEAERTAGVLAERERLAAEIHDTVAQGLSSIQLLLRAAERTLPTDQTTALAQIEQAREAAQANLAEARRFVQAWSPLDLQAGSLSDALQRLCVTTASNSDVKIHYRQAEAGPPLPTTIEVTLLRIAQSALANAVQHAHAHRIEVTLSVMTDEVALDVVDDGIGFDPGTLSRPGQTSDGTGFGLAVMRARARALNGSLVIESCPGDGTPWLSSFPTHTRNRP